MKHVLIGSAFGLGAKLKGSCDAPYALEKAGLHHLLNIPQWVMVDGRFERPKDKLEEIVLAANYFKTLADKVLAHTHDARAIMIGGDHSVAIGHWSGVAAMHQAHGQMGLIWVDAHLDAHTFETTPSKNIHGMPLAVLLGLGHPALTHVSGLPVLAPEHLVVFGARCFESGEHALLKSLGVRIVYQDEIDKIGLDAAWHAALQIVRSAPKGFGVSIDLDAFDPKAVAAVGSPEAGGIDPLAFIPLLKDLGNASDCLGLECAEYQPSMDIDCKTLGVITAMIQAWVGLK